MKKVIVFFILATLFFSCKKEKSGTMLFSMKYTTGAKSSKSITTTKAYYTGFGDYITSVSPHLFLGKFGMLGFQKTYGTTEPLSQLLFINGNMSDDDPLKIADFSNNAEVSFSPDLGCLMNDHFEFVTDQITFEYFFFDLLYFYQEVDLPSQYNSVNIAMFNGNYCNQQYWSDSVKVNNVLKIKHHPLIYNIFNTTNGWPSAYIFGNCDSTFVYNLEGNEVPGNSLHFPFGGSTILQIVRSNKYSPVVINTPGNGETVKMNATVSFNTENLIQIYAGADNIPYTSDDIFIYAPNFWERIMVKVIVE